MTPAPTRRFLFILTLSVVFICGHTAAYEETDEEEELFFSMIDRSFGYYEDGRTDLAVELVEKASNEFTNTNWSYTTCGAVLSYMGESEKAIQYFDLALDMDGEYASAWYKKGKCLSDLGMYDEANHCFDRAEKLNPRYQIPWNARYPFNILIGYIPLIMLILGIGGLFVYVLFREVYR